jgi:hypothetical protein
MQALRPRAAETALQRHIEYLSGPVVYADFSHLHVTGTLPKAQRIVSSISCVIGFNLARSISGQLKLLNARFSPLITRTPIVAPLIRTSIRSGGGGSPRSSH